MASDGIITHKMIEAFEGRFGVPKTPVKVNEHFSRSHLMFAFSDQNWGQLMRMLTEMVKKCTYSQIEAIVWDAQMTPLILASKHVALASLSPMMTANPYDDIYKSNNLEVKWLICGSSLLRISLLSLYHCYLHPAVLCPHFQPFHIWLI